MSRADTEQPGMRTATEQTPFFGSYEPPSPEEVAPELYADIDEWVASHPGGGERLIPLLHRLQERLSYLPFPVQEYVAEALGLSPVHVYGVVSFYHLFTTTPRGRHRLKVCTGTACFVRRSQRLIDAVRDATGVDVGGVSEDRAFSLEEVRCLGACGLAPAMMVDDQVHGKLTPQAVRTLIAHLRSKARGGER